jgi:uncharacterized protein (DUF58 family)
MMAHPQRGRLKLIDPEALGKMKGVALRARVVADGILQGLHKSPHQGASIEFAEHKEYAPGDEIKHVDWKAFGRLDKYYVKKFEHETNLQSLMVVDASGSMGYGAEGKLTKFEYASVFATTVAYLLLKQQDAVGLLKFDESVSEVIPPRARMTHLSAIADSLERSRVKKGTNLEAALRSVVDHLKKRGMVLLFSDFFGEDEGAFKTLKTLVARGHDVTAIQVLDGDELDFPFKEMTLFEGLESDLKLLVEPQIVRKEYLERMKAHQARIKRLCLESQAGYFLADTREPPGNLVLKWLRERKQVAQRQGREV